jgi:hypothetical protein
LVCSGSLLTGISFFAVVIYSILDKIADKKLKRAPPPSEKINLKAIFKFDARFWLIAFVTLTYYSGVTPFIAVAE